MAVINLIEQERHLRRQFERKVRLIGLAWGAVVLMVLAGWGGVLLYLGALQFQSARIQEERTKLQPAVQALQRTQAELNALQPLVTTLQSARTDTGRWQRFFYHLSQHTPPNCFLTHVELGKRSDPKKPMEVVIRGTAESQETVGELMLRLNQNPDLENIRLDFTQERRLSESVPAFDFQLTAQVKGTAVQTKEEKKDGQQ